MTTEELLKKAVGSALLLSFAVGGVCLVSWGLESLHKNDGGSVGVICIGAFLVAFPCVVGYPGQTRE